MIVVESPGLLTTVQDLGRPALRAHGLPPGGAADTLAHRTANAIVGNTDAAATLECALVGPTLRFKRSAVVAVCGARVAGVAGDRRIPVPAGGRLSLGRIENGVYAYLAVAGGFDLPEVLGSRATDVRLRFGGHDGRALTTGDRLRVLPQQTRSTFRPLHVSPAGRFDDEAAIRVVDGRDAPRLTGDWTTQPFLVSSKSDRVGIRLAGRPIALNDGGANASSAVFPGTIQLPGDGLPIVLSADAQTLGGYPQIGHVIRADMPRLVQARPGSTVAFRRVTLADAHAAARQQERAFAMMRAGIRLAEETDAGD